MHHIYISIIHGLGETSDIILMMVEVPTLSYIPIHSQSITESKSIENNSFLLIVITISGNFSGLVTADKLTKLTRKCTIQERLTNLSKLHSGMYEGDRIMSIIYMIMIL